MNKLLTLSLVLILATTTFAQDQREIDQVRERIVQMVQEAEKLEAAGKTEKAQALRREAGEIRRHLGERIERARRGQANPREILEGLEHGIVALKKLGRHEESQHLNEIADEVRREIRGQREKSLEPERQNLKEQIDIMKIGIHGLEEAEKHDAAELLERAVRAKIVDLEERRDEESIRIREMSPSIGDQAELLAKSARIWEELGHERKAAAVSRLSHHFIELTRRDKQIIQERERQAQLERRHIEERRERAEKERTGELNERVTRIEHRMEEMSSRLDRMGQALKRIIVHLEED